MEDVTYITYHSHKRIENSHLVFERHLFLLNHEEIKVTTQHKEGKKGRKGRREIISRLVVLIEREK